MKEIADVCLIIENSYPYTTDGVASWVQRLIKSYKKKMTFAVVALTNEPKNIWNMRYSLPENVISFQQVDLSDYTTITEAEPFKFTRFEKNRIYLLIHDISTLSFRGGKLNEEECTLFKQILEEYKEGFFKHFLLSESGFTLLSEIYAKKHGKNGFIKYYYNWRNLHLKIWRVFLLLNRLPQAKIYHAAGTGFAGFQVCMMTALYQKPSVITEHSIYMQEKDMNFSSEQSSWLDEPYLREMWRNFFKILIRFEYETVTTLITFSEGNKKLIAEYGANPKKVRVIPNGIQSNLFTKARRTRITSQPPVIGMIGRIEESKDIKTFLNVVAIIKEFHPNIEAYLIGQKRKRKQNEEEHYYKECLALRKFLQLETVVSFIGYANPLDYYKKMDVFLLTSIKSTMPLVVMEAMASGLPVVATKVGACKELLYGIDDDLGPAGYIANIMDSYDIATKTMRILNNPTLANQMGKIGIQRIEKYYSENQFREKYSLVYKEMISNMRRQNIKKWNIRI
jgi:glycosyltransferase involved in cell wall biosynthesis